MSQKDFLALLLLVLGVVAGVQYARFQFQLDGVEKTVRSLVPDFHQRGSEVYRGRLFDEFEKMGLVVAQQDVDLEEDRNDDLLRVVVHYSWPLEILIWQFPREHVYSLEVPLYDL